MEAKESTRELFLVQPLSFWLVCASAEVLQVKEKCFAFFFPPLNALPVCLAAEESTDSKRTRVQQKEYKGESRAAELPLLWHTVSGDWERHATLLHPQFGMLWYNPACPTAPLIKEWGGTVLLIACQTDRWAYDSPGMTNTVTVFCCFSVAVRES